MEGMADFAIPADLTERIVPLTRKQNAVSESENEETSSAPMTYISLPLLFKLENVDAPHGLVLKPACAANTTLLTPKIDKDMEIPEESIHGLPEAFSGQYRCFRGAYVDGKTAILILDPKKLVEGI